MMDYNLDYIGLVNRPDYHPPTLVPLSAKGGKYYVCVTMPDALRKGSQKQMMRSTGTTDEKIAKTKLVALANEIYAEFDRKLTGLHGQYVADTEQAAYTSTIGDFSKVFTTNPLLIQKHGLDKDPSLKITRLLPKWIEDMEERNKSNHKERTSRRNKLNEFVKVVGDLHVRDITKVHGYQYAKWNHKQGRANKTIRSLNTKVVAFLNWCEREGHIDDNPLANLKLADFGTESLPYLPFDPDELNDLFAQEMEPQDRLCLTLLAITGARLDEIALLTWEQVKTDFGRLMYIDLRPDEIKVKTDGSHRVVPIHSEAASLLVGGTGRIFDYKLDADGKAQNAASKQLMPYVRNVTQHPRKVIHSLRGTFKQMLENAGVTSEMVDQLESGEITLADIERSMKDNMVEKRVNDKITGHSARDTSGKYGFGPLLIPRAIAVERIDLGFLNLAER